MNENIQLNKQEELVKHTKKWYNKGAEKVE